MKEIIKQGKIPEEIKYKCKCKECKTLFTFNINDLEYSYMYDYCKFVKCPYCNNSNLILFLHKYKEIITNENKRR